MDWLAAHPVCWHDIACLSAFKLRVAYEVVADPGPQMARLAQTRGTSRQSINTTLHGLADQGLLQLGYGGIELVALSALLAQTPG